MQLEEARLERLPVLSYKVNVVIMDENADVTFGVKDYYIWKGLTHDGSSRS